MKLRTLVLCVFQLVFLATLARADSWSILQQTQRDQAILIRARYYDTDSTRYVNQQCKVWVQNVVWEASNNILWLPQNNPSDGALWYSHSRVFGWWTSPQNFLPGYIIQMRVYSSGVLTSLHTAIVSSVDSTGINFLDSNWNGDSVVRKHKVTFASFQAMTQGYYTVYQTL